MSENRRTHSRFKTAIDATVTIDGDAIETTITNISLGGAQIALERRLSTGTRIDIEFRVPTQEGTIKVGASTRWSNESTAGVSFDGLRAREVWSLNKFFESLSRA